MTQKEKLEEAKKLYKTANADQRYVLESLFPELAESEDERIRKTLIELVEDYKESSAYGGFGGLKWDKLIAWLEKQGEQPKKVSIWKHWKDGIAGGAKDEQIFLIKIGRIYSISSCLGCECDYIELSELDKLLSEKQGEQKPTDVRTTGYWHVEDAEQKPAWSEEDKNVLEDIEESIINYWHGDTQDILLDWLKSLNDRVFPQPKQEWSEEDERKLLCICAWIKDYPRIADFKDEMYTVANNYIDWLKSLRPQNHWKPSDEQMEALWEAYKGGEEQAALASLYSDLKKLKQ